MCSSQWNLTRHQSQELFWNIHLCPSIQAMIQGKMLHHSFDDGETLEGMADVPCLISIRALNVSLFLTSMALYSSSTFDGYKVRLGNNHQFAFNFNIQLYY